jgi:uncharacterized protein (TIGR03663 family)
MTRQVLGAFAVAAAIVALAAALRLTALGERPMHADEAVHAAKFGQLLDHGRYEYDPGEYHGPTLYYLTLIPAAVHGARSYAALDEATLRSIPAILGVLLVAAHFLFVPLLGFRAAALSALLAAVSPAMVYYSRYYIQESLLAAFGLLTLAALCRYSRRPSCSWALAGGSGAGLMFATKETWVIAIGAMAVALVVSRAAGRRPRAAATSTRNTRTPVPRQTWLHALAALAACAVVSALFFTSFLQHPRGLVDAVAAYSTYVQRASGAASWHVHPWDYYLALLAFSGSNGAPVWTEAAILALAAAGLAVAVSGARRRIDADGSLTLLAAYAVVLAAAYSAIPYKTPWCVLGFLDAFTILAGVGASRAIALPSRPLARIVAVGLLAAAVGHLGWQARTASRQFASDPRNGWVYAHTGTGVFEIVRQVDEAAHAHPDRERMPIEVIARENLWPLPWYLRRFPGTRWETAPVNDGVHAPLILATPDMEPP